MPCIHLQKNALGGSPVDEDDDALSAPVNPTPGFESVSSTPHQDKPLTDDIISAATVERSFESTNDVQEITSGIQNVSVDDGVADDEDEGEITL
jgi:hypothetical protein